MTVGIDISQAAYPTTGVGVYTRELAKALVAIHPEVSWRWFFGSLRGKPPKELMQNLCMYPLPPTLLEPLWNQLHMLSPETLLGPIDVWHSSDWTQGPTSAKKVTTVHDLVYLQFPETLPRHVVQVHTRRMKWVVKEIDHIIAVSQSTKRDLVETFSIPQDKISVIYEAARSECVPQSNERVESVRKKYALPKEYLLFVGTVSPRKNVNQMIRAWRLVKDAPPFAIIGSIGWGEPPQMPDSFIHLATIDDADLPAFYSGAVALVLPSLYEGFGLPIVEAMACGTPVVTSNVSSMPEVGGNAAVYVDPENTESIKQGIEGILSLSSSERDYRKSQCVTQAAQFSWQKTARETFAVYQRLRET